MEHDAKDIGITSRDDLSSTIVPKAGDTWMLMRGEAGHVDVQYECDHRLIIVPAKYLPTYLGRYVGTLVSDPR